jgi:hypothetical protein
MIQKFCNKILNYRPSHVLGWKTAGRTFFNAGDAGLVIFPAASALV